jgi:hypothetical protein
MILHIVGTKVCQVLTKVYFLSISPRPLSYLSQSPAWYSGYSVGRKDLMILASGVRILLWDVSAGLSDETV